MEYLDFSSKQKSVREECKKRYEEYLLNKKEPTHVHERDFMVLLASYHIDSHLSIICEYDKIHNNYSLYVQKDEERTNRSFRDSADETIRAAKLIYLYHTGREYDTQLPYVTKTL